MTDRGVQYDVQVSNAHKSHDKTVVFNGLNMNVPSGTIYGLLGPSGCGKSTLLQCILGTMTLDSGTVDLKAESLKNIGYMPQDLCLEPTLTMDETFEFYGSVFQMSKAQIENRKHELHTFLQLPDMDCLIQNLSGGQSRRVSLAIALIHDPRIILLDEPTVGVDSILRHEIWSQFVIMAEQNKKTIIITTHYIEEAIQAGCIGLMRNGVIAEEGPPQDIISKFDSDSLESAFLSVCFNQERHEAVCNTVQTVDAADNAPSTSLMRLGKKVECHRIKALMRKNLKVFSRDYWLIFSAFLLPILQAYTVSVGLGNNMRGLKVAYANDEISHCQSHSSVNGCIYDENNNLTMSCDVIRDIESHDFTTIRVKDHTSIDELMMDKTVVAFIYFPKNYTRDLILFLDDFENYQMDAYVYLNKNNFLESHQIQRVIINAMNDLKENALNGCSMNSRTVRMPINIQTLLGKDVEILTHSMVGIFLVTGSFYYSSIFSVTMMLSEKMDGVLGRSMIAGVTVLDLLISLFCFATFLILTQSLVPVVITYMVFSNPIQITSGLYMYAVSMVVVGWQGFLFGLLAAVVSPTKSGGVHVMNGLAMSLMLVSGGTWPLEAQAPYLQAVTQFLPMGIAGKAINSVTLRGWEWDHPLILTYVAILLVHVVLLVLALILLGRFKKDAWVLHK